jgi:hypothetical protein
VLELASGEPVASVHECVTLDLHCKLFEDPSLRYFRAVAGDSKSLFEGLGPSSKQGSLDRDRLSGL